MNGWGARIRTWDRGTKTRCLTTWLRPTALEYRNRNEETDGAIQTLAPAKPAQAPGGIASDAAALGYAPPLSSIGTETRRPTARSAPSIGVLFGMSGALAVSLGEEEDQRDDGHDRNRGDRGPLRDVPDDRHQHGGRLGRGEDPGE